MKKETVDGRITLGNIEGEVEAETMDGNISLEKLEASDTP